MNARSAKAKGRHLQNRIARDLAQRTGFRYGSPNDDLADLRGRLMGAPGADIVRSERVMRAVPFYVEAKNSESWNVGPKMFSGGLGVLVRWYLRTAEKAQQDGSQEVNIPIVVAAKAHFPPIVVLEDSPRWRGKLLCERRSGIIYIRVPVMRLDGAGAVLSILAWQDFLDLWCGEEVVEARSVWSGGD